MGEGRKTCRKGNHPWTEENTIWEMNKGVMRRRCRTCRNLADRRRWAAGNSPGILNRKKYQREYMRLYWQTHDKPERERLTVLSLDAFPDWDRDNYLASSEWDDPTFEAACG